MAPAAVPLLIISGSMGTGKTTVLWEASDLLAEAGTPHAAIDLDWLGQMHPQRSPHSQRLVFTNLAAVWPNYLAAGAERLIVARVVEDRAELAHYQAAVPGAQPIVCRLTAPIALMHERVRIREPGMNLEHALERATNSPQSWNGRVSRISPSTTFPGRPIGDVAREVLFRAGWL